MLVTLDFVFESVAVFEPQYMPTPRRRGHGTRRLPAFNTRKRSFGRLGSLRMTFG